MAIGDGVRRVDAVAKVKGLARYTDDTDTSGSYRHSPLHATSVLAGVHVADDAGNTARLMVHTDFTNPVSRFGCSRGAGNGHIRVDTQHQSLRPQIRH